MRINTSAFPFRYSQFDSIKESFTIVRTIEKMYYSNLYAPHQHLVTTECETTELREKHLQTRLTTLLLTSI